jgi:hypothetical protein
MQLTKYKNINSKILVPTAERAKFEGGLLKAVQIARNGGSLRDIQISKGGEDFGGRRLVTADQKRRAIIGGTIVGIGRAFGATGEVPSDVLRCLVDFTDNNFQSFAIEEIKLAFDLAASGAIDADCSLYGKPLNLDWFSRVLRAYKKNRQKVAAVLAESEEQFQKIINTDEAKESEKRNEANLAIIEKIVQSFEGWKAGNKVDLFVYHFSFLQKIGALEVDPEAKLQAFQNAKIEVVRQLQQEKEAEPTTIKRQAKEKQIADILSGTNERSGRQAKFAICQLIEGWFDRIGAEPVTVDDFRAVLLRRYQKQSEELCRVRFVVSLSSFAGNQKQTRPLDRAELEQLLSKIDGKITSIKIALK